MKGRHNTIRLIIGSAVCIYAIVAILWNVQRHRSYERASKQLNEREALLDQAQQFNDKADRLIREAADDIKSTGVKINALEVFKEHYPDEDVEFDRRCTEIETEIRAIKKKHNDVDVLIEQAKNLISVVQSK